MSTQIPIKEENSKPVQSKGPQILKKFPGKKGSKQNVYMIVGSLLVVLAGVGTGWMLSTNISGESSPAKLEEVDQTGPEQGLENVDVDGLDEAEGILVKGGIEGEGTYHLERQGGESQNVYLTSTVIDLASMEGKKVHVWGETLSAIHASWLMDVVKIKEIK